jgi:flagellar motility protein MotE (MotC chaperone)
MRAVLAQILALLAVALVPLALGEAEEAKVETKVETQGASQVEVKAPVSNACLASEEIIQDLQIREEKLKAREAELAEREKDLDAQKKAVAEELAKLDEVQKQAQGAYAKEVAEREEKVNKLIETFETMSPKAAAAVLGGVDEELAVIALSRLSTVKAGKILSNLNPEKSSKLSELIAFGQRKEKVRGESVERTPATSSKR